MDGLPLPLPNPVVYLNYLEPNIAFEYEVTRNIYIATLGVVIWDILSCVQQDWKLLSVSKPQPVFFAYHLSRWCALVFNVISVLGHTGPISNCRSMAISMTVFCVVSVMSSDFLFLTRVCAVYYDNKLVCFVFILLWICNAGALCLLFTGIHFMEIAHTEKCITTKGEKYVAVSFLVPLFFDTMVYIAIMIKLLPSRKQNEKKVTRRSIFRVESLPRLSHAIMRGGQQYYLIKVCCSVIMTILWLIPSIPSTFQVASSVPVIGLTSSMACRVYRKLKLEMLDKDEELRAREVTADAVFTTCVQASLTEVLSAKDAEAATRGYFESGRRSLQIIGSD
ncbi:hypothetical protein V8B97DRAFT_1939408 [Scleroderma yunnanense]